MPAIYTSNAIKCNGEQRYKRVWETKGANTNRLRGRPFRTLREVWVISEKICPADWFRGKKILVRNTWRKKFLHRNSLRSRPVFSRAVFSCAHYTSKRLLRRLTRKIYLSWCVMLEKNLTPLYVRKNNPITRPLNTTKYIWSNSSRKSRFWHNDKHLKPISTAQSYSISRMVGRPARALLSNRMFF